jgi:16S rRNA (cytosine967-C5)-methyltransferase
VPGFAARRFAATVLESVLTRGRPLDEQLDDLHRDATFTALEERDRALVRRLCATVLRRLGTLRTLITPMLQTGLPKDAARADSALLLGAAQILWLKVPNHAAVDLSVRLVQQDRRLERYAGLVNAVLRRIIRESAAQLAAGASTAADTPAWLLARWTAQYGAEAAHAIAAMHAQEPPLDLSVKADPALWAERLQGIVLPTGTVRMAHHGPVTALSGYDDGAWWVQDAAAALPARLFGDVQGQAIADLCAAPGGKTAQLAQAGARVTAIDRVPARVARLRDNLARLKLTAEVIEADALTWTQKSGPFDGVLLDAPCSSTGTIRRHPDIAWLKKKADITALATLQGDLLRHAVALLRSGGTLIYCVCSLEREEGEDIVAAALVEDPRLTRHPVLAQEIGGLAECITDAGDVRTLPFHLAGGDAASSGLDGFYIARLTKR